MNIAILIPCTSKNRNYKTIHDCELYSKLLKSFSMTYDKEHTYTFFIGIDTDDIFYTNIQNLTLLRHYIYTLTNVSIEFLLFKPSNGNVVMIWNNLFEFALNYNTIVFDYFHQAGDDIIYLDKGWVNGHIEYMISQNNIGVCGMTDLSVVKCQKWQSYLLTQSFTSRKHYDIFNQYFHPEIKNWYCDNYITEIYKLNKRQRQLPYRIINSGGEPRYNIVHCSELVTKLIIKNYKKITKYIN